jgi:hypothetical protein
MVQASKRAAVAAQSGELRQQGDLREMCRIWKEI